jgi:hypothetical protein
VQGDAGEHEIVRGFACGDGVEGHHSGCGEVANIPGLLAHVVGLGFQCELRRVDEFLAPLACGPGDQRADRDMDLADFAIVCDRD